MALVKHDLKHIFFHSWARKCDNRDNVIDFAP
jgi:hypothetical protein